MRTVLNSKELLREVEEKIGYTFQDPSLLQQALTHSSYSREMEAEHGSHAAKADAREGGSGRSDAGNPGSLRTIPDYERLEFLGDAVLELITSRWLYERYPKKPEGELTKMRARIVCEASLSYIARQLGLGQYLVFSHGEEKTGGRERDSILCDVVEAVLGAVYLDSDFATATAMIDRVLFSHLAEIPKQRAADYKSALQEYLQGKKKPLPTYPVVEEEGPPHDRTFTIALVLEGQEICRARGRSKKEAAQQAAKKALELWRNEWN